MSTLLKIYVKPRASRSLFPSKIYLESKEVEAMLRSPPDKGKANKELIELVANFFGVSKSNVSIVSGLTSREKTVKIEGIEPKNAWELLQKSMI